MSKASIKFYITIILSILLMSSNSIAFHKENSKEISKVTEWDGTAETKKDFENQAEQQFCAFNAKGGSEKIQGDPIKDLTTGEQRKDDVTGEPVFEEIVSPIMTVYGYHSSKSRKTGKVLRPTPLNGLNFNINANWTDIKLITVLKMYCLQDSTKDRPSRFKDSYLEDFYKKVAAENGYFKSDGKLGDYNKKLLGPEGRGPKEGRDILIDGIIISNPNAVWYLPDFLMKQDAEIKKKKKIAAKKAEKKRIAAEKEKKRKAREKAKKEGNEQWISENKQNFLDQLNKKLNEYKKTINDLEKKRDFLFNQYSNFEEKFIKANKLIRETFDDLNNPGDENIRKYKKEIRFNEEIYLSGIENKDYKNRLNKIKKINFKKYKNYTTLKNLIKRAEKSKKVENFVGNESIKAFGFTWKQKKIGFIQEFKNLENRKLGSGSDVDESNMYILNEEIKKHINDIDEFITKAVLNLVALDEEIKNKIDWPKIAIYLVVIIFFGFVIYYVLVQQRKMKDIKEEADKKVGSLKNELEDKIRNTSDQIKSASRDVSKLQQSSVGSNQPKPTQETPKTPEQIITEKYDQLVSDYKDALDDFSKVAEFKERWQGLALTRKERQDGTKTILINSTRPFEKAEIWCVTFSEKYFAFPGSSVKFNMATYMNLDFEKAGRDFKGVFSISSGSNYSTEPSVLRRGGAGFVVERAGKIIFPN